MKRTTLLGALAVLVALAGIAYYALTRPAESPAGTLSGEEASPLPPLSYEDHGQYYDITAHYPQATALRSRVGIAADEAAVGAMKKFIMDTAAQFKKDARLDNLTEEDISMRGFDQGRKVSLDIVYLIASSPRTISYIFTINEDTGGAHGNTFFKTFTFDLSTGRTIALADLFAPGNDYLGTLSTIARAKLPDILGESLDERTMQDGTTPDAENFENFFLDGGTLAILFPPYQVAAYAAGPQTLPLPLTDLKDALKPEYQAK